MYLNEFTTPRAVPQYGKAIAPGKHCPLFGIGAVLRGIDHITLIYLGTQDCVYYAKKEMLDSCRAGSSRILAVQLSDSDLIFGIRPQLEKLLEQEALREDTRAVFLVTSCSVEVISEDLKSVAELAERRTGKKVVLIPSENFKTFSYFRGMETALAALTACIRPGTPRAKSFAVLGPRHPGAEESEPVRFLLERGWTLQSVLPFAASMERIENLSTAEFTLVLDGTGLETARTLERNFGIPFVRFDEKLNLSKITAGWKKLAALTGEPLDDWIAGQVSELEAAREALRPALTGKTFFYSQVILYPFETCLFLAELGMRPAVIFLGSVIDQDETCRKALAARCNPRMLQNASGIAVEAMLDEAPPDYFIGAVGRVIQNYPVIHVNLRTRPVEAGFAFYRNCLRQLADSLEGGGKP